MVHNLGVVQADLGKVITELVFMAVSLGFNKDSLGADFDLDSMGKRSWDLENTGMDSICIECEDVTEGNK